MLAEKKAYYADPNTFNDPFDCKPSIINDIEDYKILERIYYQMALQIWGKEQTIKNINYCRHYSTQYGDFRSDKKAQQSYIYNLEREIHNCLYKKLGEIGVFSLSENWNCSLMWSHYADNHKGICIGYDTSSLPGVTSPKKINYNKPRTISMSLIKEWILKKSTSAKDEIKQSFFFTKSSEWEYEQEWRDIAKPNGIRYAPYDIHSIYFGMNCSLVIQATILKLMGGPNNNIQFHKIYQDKKSFKLLSRNDGFEELDWMYPEDNPNVVFADYHSDYTPFDKASDQ
jgi:hypothetical protein